MAFSPSFRSLARGWAGAGMVDRERLQAPRGPASDAQLQNATNEDSRLLAQAFAERLALSRRGLVVLGRVRLFQILSSSAACRNAHRVTGLREASNERVKESDIREAMWGDPA